jgi:hypothetical protein
MTQHIVTHEDTTAFAPHDSRWCAYDDSTYDGPGCPLGKGATEAEAIMDLEEQLDAADEAAEAARLASCDVCNGTGWITVRTTFPHSFVCAGDPPEDARGMVGVRCPELSR